MVQRRPLVLLALLFIAGVYLARRSEESFPELVWFIFASLAFFVALVSWLFSRKLTFYRRIVYVGVVTSFFFFGAFAYSHARLPVNTLYPKLAQIGAIRGTVVSYPITRPDRTSFVLKPYGAPGYFQVFYYHRHTIDFVPVAYGDLLVLRASVKEPQALEGFDYPEYLHRRDIWGIISIFDESQIQKLAHSQGFWLLQMSYACRLWLFRLIDKYLAPQEAGLLKGLLFGDTSTLSKETESDFRDAGVLHVLAVSGANLGMLLLFIWGVLNCFHFSYTRLYLVAAPLVLLYLWVVGFEVSLVRASLIFFFVTVGLLCAERGWILKRWADPLQGLAAAALVLLWLAPESLFDVSFQLSFAATGAILLVVLFLWPWLDKRLRPSKIKVTSEQFPWTWRVVRWLTNFILISLAAQIGVAPFLAYHFDRFYGPISLLANLAIVPLVTVALWGGILVLMLGAVHLTFLAELIGTTESALLSWISQLADFFASLPGAFWQL